MNVQQLIEYLSNYDGETMVVVAGYEGGVNEVNSIVQIKIALDVNTESYYGKHDEYDEYKHEGCETTSALIFYK